MQPVVAITGANGTIGYNAVLHALRKGYRVRCIIRRPEAIATIKRGPSIQKHLEDVDFVIVPDNTIPDAYDEALEGVEFVVHIAGVWPKPNYHPDNDIWYPFVRSMENMLSAAEKAGTVKRIVFTQAGAALVDPSKGDTLGTRMEEVLDEYVEVNPHTASLRPPLASPHHAYSAAKAYCMTYLRELQEKNDLPFSIVQVIPGTVIGPSELAISSAEAYAQMDRMSKALLFNDVKPRYAFGFVHVEDCARVHVEALSSSKVPDREIPHWFVAAGSTPSGKSAQDIWKEVGDMVEMEFGQQVANGVYTVGRDNLPINMPYRVDSTRTQQVLLDGKCFESLRDCVREVAKWYISMSEKEKNAAAGA